MGDEGVVAVDVEVLDVEAGLAVEVVVDEERAGNGCALRGRIVCGIW